MWHGYNSSIVRASLSTNQSSEPTLLTEDMPTLDRCNRILIGVLNGWARNEREGGRARRLEERREWKETEGSREKEGVQRKGGEEKTCVC